MLSATVPHLAELSVPAHEWSVGTEQCCHGDVLNAGLRSPIKPSIR